MIAEEMLLSLPDLSLEAATDYLQWRKQTKAPLNMTAWKMIVKQIIISGWHPDEALGEAMAAGWRGLRAEWLANRVRVSDIDKRGFVEKHTNRDWAVGLDDFMAGKH